MIAADSSTIIAFIQKDWRADTQELQARLTSGFVVLPPAVQTELLSANPFDPQLLLLFPRLPVLEITPGYWERAGRTRYELIKRRLKAHLGDALIAQSCIDHDVPLITRDGDFRNYADHCGLKLAV